MLSLFALPASGYVASPAAPLLLARRSPGLCMMAETPLPGDAAAGSTPKENAVPVVPVPESGSSGELSLPPESFLKLIEDCAQSTQLAMDDGNLLMEIEFPPLPTSKLEDSGLSAYDILGANLTFAVELAKRLAGEWGPAPDRAHPA